MTTEKKARTFWANYMSMYDDLTDAEDFMPKAEREDLRAYVEKSAFDALAAENEKLKHFIEYDLRFQLAEKDCDILLLKEELTALKAKVEVAVEAVETYLHERESDEECYCCQNNEAHVTELSECLRRLAEGKNV